MSTLLHPLSLSMLRDAADSVVSDALMWAKYATGITESVDEIITDVLEELAEAVESAPVTDRYEIDNIVSDFCDEVASSLEMMSGNGLASDLTDGDLIYTADILEYYTENPGEVNEALAGAYGGLSDFATIGDAMSAGVALALYDVASEEISEVIRAFEEWARDEMINHIFA